MEKRTYTFRLTLLIFVAISFPLILSAQKIAFLADTHVSPGNQNDMMLKLAVEEINASDCDFVVLAGDLTNEGSDEQLYNIKKTLDKFQKPLFVIPGNHENNWSQSACKTFNDIWGQDRFIVDMDSLVVVGINCGPYMKMGDGHIKQEDLNWLKTTLSTEANGKKVLSVCHYPLLDDLDNCHDYVSVLEQFPVIGHFCGHYHSWRQYKAGEIEGVICRALDMKNGNFGYSVLKITSDSMKVYDKRLGHESVLKYAYKINCEGNKMTQATKPEKQKSPVGYDIKCIYRDSASVFTRVGVDNRNYYFGNSLGYIVSINKKTNKCIWKYKTNASLFSRPAVKGKYVIVPTADKRLLWIDKKSGKLITEKQVNGPFVADGIERDGVLYQGGYCTFQAWCANGAKIIWEYDSIGNYCQAAPTIFKDKIVFGAWDTNLRMLNRKTGKLLWQWNNGKSVNLLSPGNCVPIVNSDKVIIVAPDRYMTALATNEGTVVWRDKTYKVRESLGVSEDGLRAYAKTMDGEIICVSTQGDKFHTLWVTDAGFGYEHAPCVILEQKGIVYAGYRRGKVVALDAKDGTLLWSYSVGTSEINGFDVDNNGKIYISLIEGSLWTIVKK